MNTPLIESTHAGPEELLALKARHLMPCTYHFYQQPPQIVRGEGATLIDHTGRTYIDALSGVGVMNAGHCNPAITEAAIEQIRTLQHTTTIYLTEPVLRLAAELSRIVPVNDPRFFFCVSGSEAVEFALMTATQVKQRPMIIAAHNGLHGRTRWAMSATGLPMWRSDPFPMDDRVVHVPFDDADALRQVFEAHRGRVAGFIAEPIQGNGGINVPGAGWWTELRKLCDEHDVALIADEVQTGFNRTGRWFACEHWNVEADMVCMSKGLGNGFPIAAVAVRGDMAKTCLKPAASTHGGNPVSAAAALASIAFHREQGLGVAAQARGQQLREGLDSLSIGYPGLLGSPRGVGLMLGVPVRSNAQRASSARCDALLESLKDVGVLAGKTGPARDVLAFLPPLVITPGEVRQLIDAVDEAAAITLAAEHG